MCKFHSCCCHDNDADKDSSSILARLCPPRFCQRGDISGPHAKRPALPVAEHPQQYITPCSRSCQIHQKPPHLGGINIMISNHPYTSIQPNLQTNKTSTNCRPKMSFILSRAPSQQGAACFAPGPGDAMQAPRRSSAGRDGPVQTWQCLVSFGLGW